MNDFYVITPTNGDIQHHGILGQKWGRRNGPPYPLDGSDHSAAEKKAGWRSSLKSTAKKVGSKGASMAKSAAKKAGSAVKKNIEAQKIRNKEADEWRKNYKAKEAAKKQALKEQKANIKANKTGTSKSNTLAEARSKDINKLSTKELREYNDRLNAENQFRNLTKQQGGSLADKGKKAISNEAKVVIGAVVTPLLISAGKSYLSKSMNVAKNIDPTIFVDRNYKGGALRLV